MHDWLVNKNELSYKSSIIQTTYNLNLYKRLYDKHIDFHISGISLHKDLKMTYMSYTQETKDNPMFLSKHCIKQKSRCRDMSLNTILTIKKLNPFMTFKQKFIILAKKQIFNRKPTEYKNPVQC